LIRYGSDEPTRFDTLRRVSVFVIAGGLVAPFVSSFFDAAVVTLMNGEDYWAVWKMRFPANVLSQLAVVPALAAIIRGASETRAWRAKRLLEAMAIGAGLLVVSFFVTFDIGTMGLSYAPLPPFLPLILWAAVRFGSTGVAVSVLGTVLLVVGGALYGEGILNMVPPEARIRTMQVFLISATLPLLCLGALVEERRNALTALNASDVLKSSILLSMPGLVAVIDRSGRILTANESWQRAPDKGVNADFSADAGASYLAPWAAAAARGLPYAIDGYTGISSVLDGTASGFLLEYRSDVEPERWWMMSVVPLRAEHGGAVVTHTDVTDRKRAELEAQQSRDELTHAWRVWVMGELTATLAHQVNQPLTAIIGNAHAASEFLGAEKPRIAEARESLVDIVLDAERAADVTHSIRDMLRRDTAKEQLLDLNEVVQDTIKLVTNQAAQERIALNLRLGGGLPLVRGTLVQMRQVVLNLTMNAIEALADSDVTSARTITIRTQSVDGVSVRVTVEDTGTGIPSHAEGRAFEPLFTTKSSGMGMGLPIARRIVEAHGGLLRLCNSSLGRTVFEFTLPAADTGSIQSRQPTAQDQYGSHRLRR
jgi:signal transduction histidine kinase